MGAEFTDPFKNCCCAAPAKITGNGVGVGDPIYGPTGYESSLAWIIMIQANWRGKVQRMRYKKRREERRKKSTHFLTQDQLETINKRRTIELRILFDTNEYELDALLETHEHRYRTSGATYNG